MNTIKKFKNQWVWLNIKQIEVSTRPKCQNINVNYAQKDCDCNNCGSKGNLFSVCKKGKKRFEK